MSGKPLRDVVADDLDVLFCGINPSLLSAARGHHFARPGNRFWPALHLAGLTPTRFGPEQDGELLPVRARGDQPGGPPDAGRRGTDDGRAASGAAALHELVARYRPRAVAVLGITAWRVAVDRPRAVLGIQPERVGGATTWVAPNPSGLNAHYQLPELAAFYRRLRDQDGSSSARASGTPGR